MALTKVTGQVIKNTTDVTVGVLTVTNTLAVGGTVSIGGTLTYEDVTNVDAVRASLPTAVLLTPVVNASKAPVPIFVFVSVNPIPNLPAVIATPTLMFCRKVAFVLVLIFSVPATPVKPDPSPA